MSELLRAENIRKSFGNNEVLKGISLTASEGDFISIRGESGSGKSTLLNILGGMDRPDGGSVVFDGIRLDGLKERDLAKLRRTSVGFVFQFFNLAPYLTVSENIKLPLMLERKKISDYEDKYRRLVEYLRIENITDRLPSELSGGEQQRTAIARALIYEPKIIFLDEPTGNLDSRSAEGIMLLLKDINLTLRTTILQVTHSEINASYGNKCIEISDGKTVAAYEIESGEEFLKSRFGYPYIGMREPEIKILPMSLENPSAAPEDGAESERTPFEDGGGEEV